MRCFKADSWNVLSTSEVFFCWLHAFTFALVVFFLLLHLLYATLIVIIYLLLNYSLFWFDFECILFVSFGYVLVSLVCVLLGFFSLWHRLLRHNRLSLTMKYICTIYVYNLPRLRPKNVNRSYKIKWFHIKRDKKQMIPRRNVDRRRLRRWSSASCKYTWTNGTLLHNQEQADGGVNL